MDCVTQQLKANKIEYNTLGSICQGRGKSSSSVASSSVSQTSGTVRASASASSTGVGSAGGKFVLLLL